MIKLIKPYIEFNEVEKEFKEIFESGMFTKGKYSVAFPETLKAYTGAKYAFNATSATTALSMCLEILNIGVGDEVVVSDFSFPATANVVEACKAKPVFADVLRNTYNMDPKDLNSKITERTKAVIFVSAFGNPSGIEDIKAICKLHGIPLIHDAACGIGSISNGKKVGNIADLECFSFHPRKLLTSGEGGAITTNNSSYAERLTIKLSHGASILEGKFDFADYGYNYRLPELQCVMLIKQIEKLDEIVQHREKLQKEYSLELEKLGYKQQAKADGVVHNIQSLVYTVPEEIDRDDLIQYLKENNIESTIGTYCLSGGTYFKNKYNSVQKNAKYLEENTITLPCYESIPIESVIKVINTYHLAKDK